VGEGFGAEVGSRLKIKRKNKTLSASLRSHKRGDGKVGARLGLTVNDFRTKKRQKEKKPDPEITQGRQQGTKTGGQGSRI